MSYARQGSLFVPTRNIWVPRIVAPPMCEFNTALIGNIAGAMRRASGTTYLVEENFEGSGTPSGWSTLSGSPDYDYATSPAPLRGSQSLYCPSASSVASPTFTGQDEVWVHCMFNYSATPSGTSAYPIRIDDGTNMLVGLRAMTTAGTMRLYVGTTNLDITGWTPGTTYHIWLKYVKGTGSNSVGELYRGTTTTRPSLTGTRTNGTGTTQATRVRFAGGDSMNIIADQVLVSGSEIGDVSS